MEILSAGSSFSGKFPELLEGITEIRSGHYIFNDCGQLDVGLAKPEECALIVTSTVIAKPDDQVVICDVGTKSLTSDTCHHRPGYGLYSGISGSGDLFSEMKNTLLYAVRVKIRWRSGTKFLSFPTMPAL